MLVRKIEFKGVLIEVYKFGKKVYYYPNLPGDVECTSYKESCKQIRKFIYCNNLLGETMGISFNELSVCFNLFGLSF